MTDLRRDILDVLGGHFTEGGITYAQILQRDRKLRDNQLRVEQEFTALLAEGLVHRDRPGKGAKYNLTAKGKAALKGKGE